MSYKERITVCVDKDIRKQLNDTAGEFRKSVSSTVEDAVAIYVQLNKDSLHTISKIAGVLDVGTPHVINSMLKAKILDIESRKKQLDPAALLVGELMQLGQK